MSTHRNTLHKYLEEIQEYWFHGPQRKFARDAGIAESTLSRILRQECTPSYHHVCRIIAALEKKLGRKIFPRAVPRLTHSHFNAGSHPPTAQPTAGPSCGSLCWSPPASQRLTRPPDNNR